MSCFAWQVEGRYHKGISSRMNKKQTVVSTYHIVLQAAAGGVLTSTPKRRQRISFHVGVSRVAVWWEDMRGATG